MSGSDATLFGMEQGRLTTDDYYTPEWVFDSMGLIFDIDVAAPPGGIPWIPADRFYTMADNGLTAPWYGRIWMNPPYSNASPWVARFIDHAHGVAFVPFARSRWLNDLWDTADAIAIPPNIGSFKFANDTSIKFSVFLAAFGDDCVDAIRRVGPTRTSSAPG